MVLPMPIDISLLRESIRTELETEDLLNLLDRAIELIPIKIVNFHANYNSDNYFKIALEVAKPSQKKVLFARLSKDCPPHLKYEF